MREQYKAWFLKVYKGVDEETLCGLFFFLDKENKRRVRSIGSARDETKSPSEMLGCQAGIRTGSLSLISAEATDVPVPLMRHCRRGATSSASQIQEKQKMAK